MEVVNNRFNRYRLVRVINVCDCDVTGMSPQHVVRRRHPVVIENNALNRLHERRNWTFANLLRLDESNREFHFRPLSRIIAEDREGLAVNDNAASHRA
jgi:hypothetical protein